MASLNLAGKTSGYVKLQAPDDSSNNPVVTLPTESGELALKSDIGEGGGVVNLSANRNLIINGDMKIAQRGKTTAEVATGEYGWDRWKKTDGGMTQVIEDLNFEPNTVYTLSGEGVTTQQLTSPSSGHWTLPDIPLDARKIQLEEGTVATPFENRPYDVELARCQRYYEKSYNQSTVPGTGEASGAVASVSSNLAPTQAPGVSFKVTKRAIPTMAIYNATTGEIGKSYRVADAASVDTSFSSIGEHGVVHINVPSSANGYYFHYTANAEL